jgi:small subunit ribosomal protein S7
MSTKGSVSFSTRNERLTKFVNYIMKNGKKTLAYKILNTTFDILREKGYTNPEEVFDKALDNVMPKIECRPKRVG